MWDKVAMTIITDYFLVVVIVCMLAGAGLYSIFTSWLNRKCPDLKSLAESFKRFADNYASEQEVKNLLWKKHLTDNGKKD